MFIHQPSAVSGWELMGVGNCSGSIIVGEPQTRKCRCLEWAVGQVGTNGTGGVHVGAAACGMADACQDWCFPFVQGGKFWISGARSLNPLLLRFYSQFLTKRTNWYREPMVHTPGGRVRGLGGHPYCVQHSPCVPPS